jgi:hypothetical protein
MSKQLFSWFAVSSLALLLTSLVSCQDSGRLYSHPSTQQPHATLEFARLMPTSSSPPSIRLVEVNGKPPSAAAGAGLMQRTNSFRLHPGPVHLFVEGNTGLGVAATAHLDFTARNGAVYRLDQAIGMTEIAFMVTESGKRVASASGAKAISRPQPTNTTPFFVPIVVR